MRTFPLCLVVCGLSLQACFAELLPPVFAPGGGLVRSPALVTLMNPNATGTIFYTADGTDPRDHFGEVVASARDYLFPLSVNRSTIFRARVKSGAEWSALAAGAFTADQDFSQLLFTEVMFHARDKHSGPDFIELKNVGTVPLDLSELHFAGRYTFNPWLETPLRFAFPAGTVVPAGEFLVLVTDLNVFRAYYPTTRVDGVVLGGLDRGEMRLVIHNAAGAEAATMLYQTHAPWQVVPDNHGYFPPRRKPIPDPDPNFEDGVGFSLVRTTLDSTADSEDHRAWRASAHRFGSPGADDPAPVVPPIYINELLTRGSAGVLDAIEFYNPNAFAVDIGGWWLSDERNWPFRHQIAPGTVVPPLGYLVLDESQYNVDPNSVAFDAEGEPCYLFSADAKGVLTGYSHAIGWYPASERDVSFGRQIASDGTESFPPQSARTFGAANAGPRPSPLVISEIMYHPARDDVQYLELRNTTGQPLFLGDPQNPEAAWKVSSFFLAGVDSLPTITIPPHGHLLLARGDAGVFRLRHQVPDDVPIARMTMQLGDITLGDPPDREYVLPDAGNFLNLMRPAGTANGGIRLVQADWVAFTDRAPWPAGAAGGGAALERIDLYGSGSDPANWRVSPSLRSPGRANAGNAAPRVWAGDDRTAFVGRSVLLGGAISDDRWPGTALTSEWVQVSGPEAVQISSPEPGQTVATFPAAGNYVLRLTASDGVLSGTDSAAFDVIEPPFERWRSDYFTPSELADSTISGPLADPESDGLRNVDEYFYGSSPTQADSGHGVRAEILDGRLQAKWVQRLDLRDVTATPERADQILGPWFSASELFDRSEAAVGTMKEVTVRERLPVAGRAHSFLRLKITLH